MKKDIVLIGAGVMSATLAFLLKEINPDCNITIFERLTEPAQESSDAWNNAGTGHASYCELNYTPEKNGEISIEKAIKITESYEISKQFWTYLIEKGIFETPRQFINKVPHISFVRGENDVKFLQKRYELMKKHHFYRDMMFSTSQDALNTWMPLVMEGRKPDEKVAATYVEYGTDVDFGALTRRLIDYLVKEKGVKLYLNAHVKDIDPLKNGKWEVEVNHEKEDKKELYVADFVFIGAGGGSLRLLDKSDIDEADGYGGFPVSGLWLRCTKPEIAEKHWAKVYGKAEVGAPPMSVPHLDTRVIQGKKSLLFGPFAGFTTKFLKQGSIFDLIKSLEFDNIFPVMSVGWNNWELTKYLIQQARLTHEDRIEELQKYYPLAKAEDWELLVAGHRVQIIKKDKEKGGGKLEFGTEIIHNKQGTIAALLGASPGASTAVSAMIEVIQKCFPEYTDWQKNIQKCIPSYGIDLSGGVDEYLKVLQRTNSVLL